MLFPYHVNHLTMNWRVPLHRRAIELLARWFQVVNLDFRGAGESASTERHISLDSFGDDLEAVLDALRIETACLCAMGPAALPACHYAARAPDRVAAIAFVQGGESQRTAKCSSYAAITPGSRRGCGARYWAAQTTRKMPTRSRRLRAMRSRTGRCNSGSASLRIRGSRTSRPAFLRRAYVCMRPMMT